MMLLIAENITLSYTQHKHIEILLEKANSTKGFFLGGAFS